MSPSTDPPAAEFRRLLDLVEDYYLTGFKRRRSQVDAPAPESGVGSAEAAEPAAAPAAGQAAGQAAAAGEVPPAGEGSLESIAQAVGRCTRCRLHQGRTRTVPGEGHPHPLVMCIGEGPGAEEDRSGRPFVGPAGKYLDRWLGAVGLNRSEHCFIGNIVKCRPPGNRDPQPDETAACIPYLQQQITILKPKLILSLGRIATQILLDSTDGIGRMRGKWFAYAGIPLLPTYHPSAVLRNPDLRRAVWEDIQKIRSRLDDV